MSPSSHARTHHEIVLHFIMGFSSTRPGSRRGFGWRYATLWWDEELISPSVLCFFLLLLLPRTFVLFGCVSGVGAIRFYSIRFDTTRFDTTRHHSTSDSDNRGKNNLFRRTS